MVKTITAFFQRITRKCNDWYIIIFLLILPCLIFIQYIIKKIPLSGEDYLNQYYIWQSYLVNTLRSGHLPLWNPYVFAGTPFLANPQTGVFYPIHWLKILFANGGLLPLNVFQIFTLIEIGIGGIFFYFLMKQFVKKQASALFGTLVYVISPSIFALMMTSATIISTIIWWPLLLLCSEKFIKTSQRQYLIFLSFTLAFSWFAGHPSIFFFNGLGLFIYWVLRADWYRIGYFLKWLLLSLVAAVGLIAVQLLPALEFLRLSSRSSLVYPAAVAAPPFLKFLASLLTPESYASSTITVGALAIFFSIITLIVIKNSKVVRSWWIFLLTVIILFCGLAIFSHHFQTVPLLYNLIRYYDRILYLPIFALAVLAGIGLDSLADYIKNYRSWVYIVFILFIFLSLVLVSWLASAKSVWLTCLCGIILAVTIFLYSRQSKLIKILPVLIVIASILIFFVYYLKVINPDKNQTIEPMVAAAENIYQGQPPLERVVVPADKFIENFAMISKFYVASGWDLVLARYQDIWPLEQTGLTNNRYDLVSSLSGTSERKELSSLPRFWFIQAVTVFDNENEVLNALKQGKEDLNNTGLVTPAVGWINQNTTVGGQVLVKRYEPEKIDLQISVDKPSILVINDNYYPGWQASIDGKSVDIFVINHYMRAIKTPAGQHFISLDYRPKTLYWGGLVSIITLISLLSYYFINHSRTSLNTGCL